MPWDQFCAGRQFIQGLTNIFDVTSDFPSTTSINIRKPARKELIAHLDDVRSGEMNEHVVIGVAGRNMDCLYFFTIEMNGEGGVECNDRQPALNVELFASEPFSGVCMSDDGGLLTEVWVATGVIAMKMGVKDKPQFSRTELLKRHLDFASGAY